MLVAFYKNWRHLPLGDKPQNPCGMFIHGKVSPFSTTKFFGGDPRHPKGQDIFANHPLWPVLRGMYEINIPEIMGHISCYVDSEKDDEIVYTKRVLVEITTATRDYDPDGLPIILDSDGKLQVAHLWGIKKKSVKSPFDLIPKPAPAGANTSEFWKNFFLDQLVSTKKERCDQARTQLRNATETLNLYAVIPDIAIPDVPDHK